ncbi:hypothetical protein AVEN_236811-1 [Araneus ventricosus]|uniref:Reverse transcriptase Ty1/copia-type domain-containing protein n=1 Tax=Araneus ventricosus TaxID=182803 RepID=A0A4Y2UNJ0_ARAVE|nr:hypothetical protein AVEN_236811-1 [Araneus ventricosus]
MVFIKYLSDVLKGSIGYPQSKAKCLSTNLACNVPNSYLEAKNSADWQNWEFAMNNELDSLNKQKVWEIVDRSVKTKIVKSKWMYSLKQSDDGETKYKARLVAARFNQIKPAGVASPKLSRILPKKVAVSPPTAWIN